MNIEEFVRQSQYLSSYADTFSTAIETTSISEVVKVFAAKHKETLSKIKAPTDDLIAKLNVNELVSYFSDIKQKSSTGDTNAETQWKRFKRYYACALAVLEDDCFIYENYPSLHRAAKAEADFINVQEIIEAACNKQIGTCGFSSSSTSWWKTMAIGAGAIVLAACVIAVINVAFGNVVGIAALAAL